MKLRYLIRIGFDHGFQIETHIVAQAFAKDIDIFFRNGSAVEKKLKLLIEYRINPISILKSLNIFEFSVEYMADKLRRLRKSGMKGSEIDLWMLYVEKSRFERLKSEFFFSQNFGDF